MGDRRPLAASGGPRLELNVKSEDRNKYEVYINAESSEPSDDAEMIMKMMEGNE